MTMDYVENIHKIKPRSGYLGMGIWIEYKGNEDLYVSHFNDVDDVIQTEKVEFDDVGKYDGTSALIPDEFADLITDFNGQNKVLINKTN